MLNFYNDKARINWCYCLEYKVTLCPICNMIHIAAKSSIILVVVTSPTTKLMKAWHISMSKYYPSTKRNELSINEPENTSEDATNHTNNSTCLNAENIKEFVVNIKPLDNLLHPVFYNNPTTFKKEETKLLCMSSIIDFMAVFYDKSWDNSVQTHRLDMEQCVIFIN